MIGIIGGTGLGEALLGEQSAGRFVEIDTPFGKPSGPIQLVEWNGVPLAILARHGAGHALNPSQVPYRANIYALKSLGVSHILASGAVGSLREDFAPRELVIVDQVIDKTARRTPTFYDEGLAVHVEFAQPCCPQMRALLLQAAERLDGDAKSGGRQSGAGEQSGAGVPARTVSAAGIVRAGTEARPTPGTEARPTPGAAARSTPGAAARSTHGTLPGAEREADGATGAASVGAAQRVKVHKAGTYVCMEGPAFSTVAESNMHRLWGGDLIGMTMMPEAKLAREAEISYGLIALVTDYDCWRPHEHVERSPPVTPQKLLEEIIGHLKAATANAIALMRAAIAEIASEPLPPCPTHTCLDLAVWTSPEQSTKAVRARYGVLLERWWAARCERQAQAP